MIEREITQRLTALFAQYPFVTVTGPRQSGKTTLCRAAFPQLQYVNLEAPDQRDFAESDPRGFLAQLGAGAIIDEIQYVPALLSYLQVLADDRGGNGLFVLTGSEQFRLSDAIGQSLAGRTALLRLLPFSLRERRRTGASAAINDILYSGFYPRILDQGLDPRQALGDYFETYIERDVRRLGEIRNLSAFRIFLKLCAGRVGQLVNLSALGADAGVSHTTARQWLTILETSYLAFQLPPFHANIRKRLVKSPKLYFHDVGVASYLLGIESPAQVATHPLRGALFENVIVGEALKHRFNRGRQPNLSFFRDSRGLECDLFYETGHGIHAIEAKAGATVASDAFTAIHRVAALIPAVVAKAVVYGGTGRQSRSDCEVVPLAEFAGLLERFDVDQDVAAFVSAQKGSAPDDSDLKSLNAAYRIHIRPTLDGLDPACASLGKELFRRCTKIGYVQFGQDESNGSELLDAGKWETTKQRLLVGRGFTLRDDRPIELRHHYTFTGYTGSSSAGFDLHLSIMWRLSGAHLSRSISLNEVGLSALDSTITYSQLDRDGADVDHVVAQVLQHLLAEIGRRSGRSGESP